MEPCTSGRLTPEALRRHLEDAALFRFRFTPFDPEGIATPRRSTPDQTGELLKHSLTYYPSGQPVTQKQTAGSLRE